jgi:hypothetical protein
MNIKQLSKKLPSLTLHAFLVATFGLISLSIAALTDYAASKFRLPRLRGRQSDQARP